MKKNALKLLAAFVLILMTQPVMSAQAETKIAVVDVQMLLKETKAAKSIKTQFDKERKALEKEFSGFEDKLRVQQKELLENRQSMEVSEFNTKRKKFEKELSQTSSVVQKKKRALEKAVATATAKLRGEILKVVARLSEQENYSLVMTRQNIVIVEKELDISKTVMERLNSTVQKIMLEIEG